VFPPPRDIEDIVYFYTLFYDVSNINFAKKYPQKNIDWESRAKFNKIKLSVSKWRSQGLEPPKNMKNRFANELTKAISEGNINVDTEYVQKSLNEIRANNITAGPSDTGSSTFSRNKRSFTREKSVKEITMRKDRVKKRNTNPNFDKNRQARNVEGSNDPNEGSSRNSRNNNKTTGNAVNQGQAYDNMNN